MIEAAALKVKVGDEVRVHYHPPGPVTSFIEGVVSRVNVTTSRGPGFLIDITRDVFLGREQSVKKGYEHYVLYEQLEDSPEKVEVLSRVPREPDGYTEHGSNPEVEQQPKPEIVDAPEPEPKLPTEAEQETALNTDAETDGSPVEVESQDGQRRSGRIISIFGRRRK